MEYAARIEKFLLDVLELLDFYSLGNRAALHRYIHLKNKDYVLCKWMDAKSFLVVPEVYCLVHESRIVLFSLKMVAIYYSLMLNLIIWCMMSIKLFVILP